MAQERPGTGDETASGGVEGLAGGEFPGEGIDTTLGDKSTGGEAAREALGEAAGAPGGGDAMESAKELLDQAKDKARDLLDKAKDALSKDE